MMGIRSSYAITNTGKRIEREGAALARTEEHFQQLATLRDQLNRLNADLCNLVTITCQNSAVDPREHDRIRVAWMHVHRAFKAADHAVVTLNMSVDEPIMHPTEAAP